MFEKELFNKGIFYEKKWKICYLGWFTIQSGEFIKLFFKLYGFEADLGGGGKSLDMCPPTQRTKG